MLDRRAHASRCNHDNEFLPNRDGPCQLVGFAVVMFLSAQKNRGAAYKSSPLAFTWPGLCKDVLKVVGTAQRASSKSSSN